MDELNPEQLDEAIAQEAEQIERERNKRRILALLEAVPADSGLWSEIVVLLTSTLILEKGEEA